MPGVVVFGGAGVRGGGVAAAGKHPITAAAAAGLVRERDAVFIIVGADLLARNVARHENTGRINRRARARPPAPPAFHFLPRPLFTIIVERITQSLHTPLPVIRTGRQLAGAQ